MLHDELLKLNRDRWPERLISRRPSDNRVKINMDDIIKLLAEGADERGLIRQLPTLVAADLGRVPAVNPEDVELCSSEEIEKNIEEQIEVHGQLLS